VIAIVGNDLLLANV